MSKNQEKKNRRQSRDLAQLVSESLRRFPNSHQKQERANWVCEQWHAAHPDSFAKIIQQSNGGLGFATYDNKTPTRATRLSVKERARKQEMFALEAQAKRLFPGDELEQVNWLRKEWLERHPDEEAEVVKTNTGGHSLLTAPSPVRLDGQSAPRRQAFITVKGYAPPTRQERRAAASIARRYGLEADVEEVMQRSQRDPRTGRMKLTYRPRAKEETVQPQASEDSPVVETSTEAQTSIITDAPVKPEVISIVDAPVETEVASIVDAPVETEVASIVDVPVEAEVTSIMDAPVETEVASIVDVPVEAEVTSIMDAPVETEVASIVDAPVETEVASIVDVPVEAEVTSIMDAPVETEVASIVDAPVETEVASIVDAPVETEVASIVDVPVETEVASIVDAPVEAEVASIMDAPVETENVATSAVPSEQEAAVVDDVVVEMEVPVVDEDAELAALWAMEPEPTLAPSQPTKPISSEELAVLKAYWDRIRQHNRLELVASRDLIAGEAAAEFPDDLTAQCTWALEQWDSMHEQKPLAVSNRFFQRLRDSLENLQQRPRLGSLPPLDSPAPETQFQSPSSIGPSQEERARLRAQRLDRRRRQHFDKDLLADKDRLLAQAGERFPNDPVAQSNWACREFMRLWRDREELVTAATLDRVARQLHGLRLLPIVVTAASQTPPMRLTPSQRIFVTAADEVTDSVAFGGLQGYLLRRLQLKNRDALIAAQSMARAQPVNHAKPLLGEKSASVESPEAIAFPAPLVGRVGARDKTKRKYEGFTSRRELSDMRDWLIREARRRFRNQPGMQWSWAKAQWQRLYPESPPGIHLELFRQLQSSLNKLCEQPATPSAIILPAWSTTVPAPVVAITETTLLSATPVPVASAPVISDVGATAVPSATASAQTDAPVPPTPPREKRKGVGREARKQAEDALQDELIHLIEEAQARHPGKPTLQSGWARGQWKTRHPQKPDLVDKKFFERLPRALTVFRLRVMDTAMAETMVVSQPVVPTATESIVLTVETPTVVTGSTDLQPPAISITEDHGSIRPAESIQVDSPSSIEPVTSIVTPLPLSAGNVIEIPHLVSLKETASEDERDRPISHPGTRPERLGTGGTAGFTLSIGPGANTETFSGIPLNYLVQDGAEFRAREPKATVYALAGITYSLGSRVIRYPGAVVHGECEDAAEDQLPV